MAEIEVPKDGYGVSLSGDQVKFIRLVLNETQEDFAKRFAVSQPVIWRLEKKRAERSEGPVVVLIDLLAKQHAIQVPDAIMAGTK